MAVPAILGDRGFYKSVATIGLPVALQNLLGTSAAMVDTIMVGTQGQSAVAAVGLCAQFASLLFSAYFGFSSGGMIFFAQYWGVKNGRGIRRSFGLVFCCMLLCGLLFCAAGTLAPRFVMGVYTDKAAIVDIGAGYLAIAGFSYPFIVVNMALSTLYRATEQVRVPLYASIVSIFTNVALNWVFIFGNLGAPEMGVRGAAVATVCAEAVHLLVLAGFCVVSRNPYMLPHREHLEWDAALLRGYFARCLPVIGNELLYGVGNLLVNIIMGRQLEDGIAATAVFRILEGIIFAFFGGLANAASVIVGKKVGAGEHDGAYLDAKRLALLCPAITLAITGGMLVWRRPLIGLFGVTPAVVALVTQILVAYAFFGTVRTCNFICNMIFRSGGEPVLGAVIEICGLFLVAVPAMAVSWFAFAAPFIVVFALKFADEPIRLCVSLWYMRSGRWVKPVTPEGLEALPAFKARLHKRAA